MRKTPRHFIKDKYKLLAYSSIFVAFGLAFYIFTVPSLIEKKMYSRPRVLLNPDPIVTQPRSPSPTPTPTPTPEALMGHKTYASEKLNLKFEYATRIKAGTKIIPQTVTEIGNTIYIHDFDKAPSKSTSRHIEVNKRYSHQDLEWNVRQIFMEKPHYCQIMVRKLDERDTTPMRLDYSEIARIQVANPVKSEGGVDLQKLYERQKVCGYHSGFFTFDKNHPDVLLFIRTSGQNGDDPVIHTVLYSNIFENNKNLHWQSTIDFIK